MTTWIMVWNGRDATYNGDYQADVRATAVGKTVQRQWSTGGTKNGMQQGDSVYLIQGKDAGAGIVAYGHLLDGESFVGPKQENKGEDRILTRVVWECVLPRRHRLASDEIHRRIKKEDITGRRRGGLPVDDDQARQLHALWAEHLGKVPETAGLPALHEAEDLLRAMIGIPVPFGNSKWCFIREFAEPHAVVGFRDGSEDRLIKVVDVQAALDILPRPSADPIIQALVSTVDPSAPGLTELYTGVLQRASGGMDRAEQGVLRTRLLRGRESADCALCGRHLPSDLLRAAHIKRRAPCSEAEQRDIQNVAMLACSLGCDSLYELGYVGVDAEGKIVIAPKASGPLYDYAAMLNGRTVAGFGEPNSHYYRWHFEVVMKT